MSAPWLFVGLWSTGFVVARYATDNAAPLTFLSVRMIISAAVLAVVARAINAPRPARSELRWLAVAGVLLHAVYLGGVFVAIDQGLPSGVGALIAGLHPVVTSLASSRVLGERLSRVQWMGVGLGFAGVVAVVIDRLAANSSGVTAATVSLSLLAMFAISAGTLVQRSRLSAAPLLWGTALQYGVAAVVLLVVAVPAEGFRIEFTTSTVLAMAWGTIVLSIAAVLLMFWLLQREAAATVSSLFFLTPALSTLEGAILFDERLGILALVGLAVSLIGVALVTRRTATPNPTPKPSVLSSEIGE